MDYVHRMHEMHGMHGMHNNLSHTSESDFQVLVGTTTWITEDRVGSKQLAASFLVTSFLYLKIRSM